jgi:glycosyltransferase involved in cell wall biosynthesis
MKVLHVPYSYPPASGGGTEVYVAQLCRHLRDCGIESVVCAPGPDEHASVVGGTRVRWFATDTQTQSLETLYGAGDLRAADQFERVLTAERPDVVHQHALSPACSSEIAKRARRVGVPVVFTVHTPAVFCQQGAMLRWGTEVCGVAWEHAACTSCVMHTLGVPAMVRGVLLRAALALGPGVEDRHLEGGPWTALRLPALMRTRLADVTSLFQLASRIVSLTPWVTDLLRRNGVPSAQIVEVPHGTADAKGRLERHAHPQGEPVRLVYLGRVDPTKGTLVVVEALAAAPSLNVTLDIFGIGGNDMGIRSAKVPAMIPGFGSIRRWLTTMWCRRFPDSTRSSFHRRPWRPDRWWCSRRSQPVCRSSAATLAVSPPR